MNIKSLKTGRFQKRKRVPGRIPLPQERIPMFAIILLVLAFISLIIVFVARRSVVFADFFNSNISAFVRSVLAYVTNPLPFSLAEMIIILLPAIVFLLILYGVRQKSSTWRSVISYVVTLISIASVIFSVFVFAYGIGYYVPTIDKRTDIENTPVSAEELRDTALKIAEDLKRLSSDVSVNTDGSTVMPYSFNTMNRKLNESYSELSKKYGFIQPLKSNTKPVLLSTVMSYTHFTGFYTFFTGETNVNMDFPDYSLVFTAAHELAHQRGIARENEANFIAFLACIGSDDPYIQYCGYMNMYEYVSAALYSANPDMYKEVYLSIPDLARNELVAYSAFYSKYRDSGAAKVGNSINDAFLKANGTAEGTKIYGTVANLAVAYYKNK